MSPTVISSQQQSIHPKVILNIKEQFLNKRIIVCQQDDGDILQGFNTLLSNYPQWYHHTVLVFLTNRKEENKGSVYYFNKETFDLVSTLAAVVIIKSGDQFVFQDLKGQQINVDNTVNYTNIATLLNKSLVSIAYL
jgi:hypothetical protein